MEEVKKKEILQRFIQHHIEAKEYRKKHPYIKINGSTNVLLIAPHGYKNNDGNTGIIVEKVAKQLGCSALINKSINREIINFNDILVSNLYPEFIKDFEEIINTKQGQTLVLWIHGMTDKSARGETRTGLYRVGGKKAEVHGLLGIGQGKVYMQTAYKTKAKQMCQYLTEEGMNTFLTRTNASNFRANLFTNMNQYCLLNGYKLNKVQSMQLEIKYRGFRELKYTTKTATKIANAIKKFLAQ